MHESFYRGFRNGFWAPQDLFSGNLMKVLIILGMIAVPLPHLQANETVEDDRDSGKIQVDPRVWSRLQYMVDEYCRDPLSRSIFMVKTGEAELEPNMVSNPGFEEVWGQGTHKEIPQGEDWRESVAYGWGITPRIKKIGGKIDTIKYEEKGEEFGWRSGRIAHTDGDYNRNVPGVKHGSQYLVRILAKLYRMPEMNMEKMPGVSLRVQWWGKGWLHTDIFTVSQNLTETGRWVMLEMVVIPPEKAEVAVVFLLANDMRFGTEVLFDNLSFQKIIVKNNK